MRSLFLVLLLVAFAIASSAVLSSGEERLTKVTASDFDGLADGDCLAKKRRLRVDSTGIAEEEERAFTLITKLTNRFTKDPAKLEKIAKNKKYRLWLKEDENPITILTTLGLKGQGPAWKLKDDPRFHEYLEFSALWRRKKGLLAKEWWQFWRKNAW